MSMAFCHHTDVLILNILRTNGIFQHNLDINNIVPWTYSDLLASSSLVGFKLPFIMDTDMIYFSPFLREIFVFEKDGEWHTGNVTHPKLSLDNLYCEK
jgi:hypothetical protein